jgi:hypothetical protein
MWFIIDVIIGWLSGRAIRREIDTAHAKADLRTLAIIKAVNPTEHAEIIAARQREQAAAEAARKRYLHGQNLFVLGVGVLLLIAAALFNH